MRPISTLVLLTIAATSYAQTLRVFEQGQLPEDKRLGELRNLNSYFPFKQVRPEDWPQRQAEIRRRILVSQGLWPMPTKAPLNAVIHGRVERDAYVVDRVFFESIPGHFVTGSLYRPKDKPGRLPAVLSPHGHWSSGRFYDAGEAKIKKDLASGAEQFEVGGRYPIQARAVQLARMGCLVFVYDMTGNADSIQITHRPGEWAHLDRAEDWGFFSAQAELRLQNMMGLQTWNSIRAVDFLLKLDDVDPARIGVTGASGGGTQSMILGAIDERIAASMPCVMVSTSMQGGCTCENACYLRIDQGNVDIAAATAPRPLGLTAADDWTVELETKGYPDLLALYTGLGHQDRLTAAFHIRFKHNYNQVNRAVMYGFFNRHFELGYDEPITERDFIPLSREEATVWTQEHPAPSGDAVGEVHEVRIIAVATKDAHQKMVDLIPDSAAQLDEYRRVVGGGWQTIIGRDDSQVGEIKFTPVRESELAGFALTLGRLEHAGEQLPIAKLHNPNQPEKGTVIWLSDVGKSALLEGEQLRPAVAHLLAAGYGVISADLIGQGEFTEDGQPLAQQRMWFQRDGKQGWHRYAGYTYGFNDSLFVQRVHDVLSLIELAKQGSDLPVKLVGIGRQAGAIAAAARSQSIQLDATYVDMQGFRFESLKGHDDPMFVPGAVRYLDVDGLLSLCVPGELHAAGIESEIANRTARAAGGSLHWHSSTQELLQSIHRGF